MTGRRASPPILGVVALLMMALVWPVPAHAAAHAGAANPATACQSTDTFSGSQSNMEHWLDCKKVPYDVITPGCSGCTTAPQVAPNSGGPSCNWMPQHTVEICYQQGVPHYVCSKYFAGSYPYQCGPIDAFDQSNAQSLQSYVWGHFPHWAKACTEGVVLGGPPSGIVAVIIKAGTGLIGFVTGSAISCAAGVATYYWNWSG